MTNNNLLNQGIDLAKSGNFQQASVILARVVKEDDLSEQGWLWLGRCRTVLQEKKYCFNKVISINPDNAEAHQELQKLWLPGTDPTHQSTVEKQTITAIVTPETAITQTPPDITKEEKLPPNKKTWVRKTVFFLIGIMVGIYIGRYIANNLAALGFFDNIDNAIALRTINVPNFTPTQEIPKKTIEPTPTVSLTESFDKRLEQAWPLVVQASNLVNAQNYGAAVPIWNQVLEIVPEYADGYYRRGQTYSYLTRSQRAKSEYDYYLQLAIDDFDKAINLNPNAGDYYLVRGVAYSDLAGQQATRADFQKLEQVAVENFIYSKNLPYKDSWVNTDKGHIKMMIGAGNCEEAIQEINRLLAAQTQPAPGLHSLLSNAQYCAGNLEIALKEFDEAVSLSSNDCLCNKAIILYGLGRFDEAMDAIENSLSNQPYYSGDRYYFRALIYADRGNIEQAQKDLDFGMTQTWGRGGMLSYVQGKIALAQNKKEDALFYFQEAEATYFNEGPMLEQIRRDLLELGGMPRNIRGTPFDITPIPFAITAIPDSTITPEATINP